jgi:hypothetical protein
MPAHARGSDPRAPNRAPAVGFPAAAAEIPVVPKSAMTTKAARYFIISSGGRMLQRFAALGSFGHTLASAADRGANAEVRNSRDPRPSSGPVRQTIR